jgi:hypothetical protein
MCRCGCIAGVDVHIRVDDSHPGRTGIDYVIRRSHWMQKHMFGVMSPTVFSVESVSVLFEYEK